MAVKAAAPAINTARVRPFLLLGTALSLAAIVCRFKGTARYLKGMLQHPSPAYPELMLSRYRHSRNIAACPQRWPVSSVRFQTVARSIKNR